MLPSVAAFLALWDDPVEFVDLHVEHSAGEFKVMIVIEAPDCPPLQITMCPMKTGEA